MVLRVANVRHPQAPSAGVELNAAGDFLFDNGFGSRAKVFGCRAWAMIVGTGTPAYLYAGFNVSSITDNAVGDYTVNLINPLPDIDYAAAVHVQPFYSGGAQYGDQLMGRVATFPLTPNRVRVWAQYGNTQYGADVVYAYVSIFR